MSRCCVFAVLALAACSDVYELGIQGPVSPMAVGSAGTFMLQYGLFWDCKTDRVWRCGSGNFNHIASVTEISVDAPTLLSATLEPNYEIKVRALAAGTPRLTATGIDIHGERQTASRTLYLLTPQEAVLTHEGACAGEPLGATVAVPVNAEVSFFPEVKNGTTTLYTDGLVLPADNGALLPMAGAPPFRYKAPSMPTLTQVKTLLEKPFSIPVRVYEPSQLDGITLKMMKPGPYYRSNIYTAQLVLHVMGDRVCQDPDPAPVRVVNNLTPDVCVLRETSVASSAVAPNPQEGATLPLVYLEPRAAGVCRIALSIKGTSVASTFELPVM